MPDKKEISSSIKVLGARTHNLKNIDVEIPINQITCLWGPSGSGKSSLAFHTLLAESKRRFLNSLPNDIKFFWATPQAADVDSIKPILPVWGLHQNNPILGSRPTLSDMISLTDHLQVIYHRWSKKLCPEHLEELQQPSIDLALESQLTNLKIQEETLYFFLAKEEYLIRYDADFFPSRSFSEEHGVREFHEEDFFWEVFRLKRKKIHQLEKRISELKNSEGVSLYFSDGLNIYPLKNYLELECPKCDFRASSVSLDLDRFTPYSAAGACQKCKGHGKILIYDRNKIVENPQLSIREGAIKFLESSHFKYLKPRLLKELSTKKISVDKPFFEIENEKLWRDLEEGFGSFPGLNECYQYLERKRYKRTVRIFIRRNQKEILCESCKGTRLHSDVHHQYLKVGKTHLSYLDCYLLTIKELNEIFHQLRSLLLKEGEERLLYKTKQVMRILETAQDLDLKDLNLSLKAKVLTTSQYQRSLLVKILSYEGGGSLFVLDEPSLGLSFKEQKKLIVCLQKIRNQGNTVLIVEHSEFIKSSADYLIEMGPEAGERGGEVLSKTKGFQQEFVFPNPPLMKNPKFKIKVPSQEIDGHQIKSFFIPLEKTTLVYGDSGSLKNSLFLQHLANILYYDQTGEVLYDRSRLSLEYRVNKPFRNVYVIDSSLGNSNSRSSVGTVLGFTPELRKHYANLSVSKSLGLEKGHFSSNSELGKCPTCEGKGIVQIEMNFLEDITLECEDCKGMKLKPIFATISDGTQSVYEALNNPMSKVIPRLQLTAKFLRLWELVKLLKLDYLSLDRTITSLSGGERLRLKLLAQLSKSVYESLLFFENLSSGLSARELEAIAELFEHLKKDGNSLIILDENENLFQFGDHSINLEQVLKNS